MKALVVWIAFLLIGYFAVGRMDLPDGVMEDAARAFRDTGWLHSNFVADDPVNGLGKIWNSEAHVYRTWSGSKEYSEVTFGNSMKNAEAILIYSEKEGDVGFSLKGKNELLVVPLTTSNEWLAETTARKIVSRFSLFAAPNPFHNETRINMVAPIGTEVTLRIYDASGRLIAVPVESKVLSATRTAITWRAIDCEGRHLPPGIYFCEMGTPGSHLLTKLVVVD